MSALGVEIRLDELAWAAYQQHPDWFPTELFLDRYIRFCLNDFGFALPSDSAPLPFHEADYPAPSDDFARVRCIVPPTVRATAPLPPFTRRLIHFQLWFTGTPKTLVHSASVFAFSKPPYLPLAKTESKATDDIPLQLYHDICSLWGYSLPGDTLHPPPMLRAADLEKVRAALPFVSSNPAADDFIKHVLAPYTTASTRLPKSALLWGPSGTGKTSLARAVLDHSGVRTIWCGTASELSSKWFGETEKRLKALFEASQQTPNLLCAIVIDEIDSVVPKRGTVATARSSETKIDLASLLMSLVETHRNHNLLLIGCTNRKAAIDEAFLRPGRMFDHFFFGRLSRAARQDMFTKCSGIWMWMPSPHLLDISLNFTGALLQRAIQQAATTSIWQRKDELMTHIQSIAPGDEDLVTAGISAELHAAVTAHCAEDLHWVKESGRGVHGFIYESNSQRFHCCTHSGSTLLQLQLRKDPLTFDAWLACLVREMEMDVVVRMTSRRLRVWDDAAVSEMCEQLLLEAKQYRGGMLLVLDADLVFGSTARVSHARSKEHSVNAESKESKHWGESSSQQEVEVLRPGVLCQLKEFVRQLSLIPTARLVLTTTTTAGDAGFVEFLIKSFNWGARIDPMPYTWDMKWLASGMVSPDGYQLMMNAAGWNTACGDRGFRRGRFRWSIEIQKSLSMNLEVGVSEWTFQMKSNLRLGGQAATTNRWFLSATTGALFTNRGQVRVLCPKLEVGDKIGFLLDDGSLYMSVNDVSFGLVFSGITTSAVCPAVSMHDIHDRILLRVHHDAPSSFTFAPRNHVLLDTSQCFGIRTADAATVVAGVSRWQTLRSCVAVAREATYSWVFRINSEVGVPNLRIGMILGPYFSEDYHDKYLTNASAAMGVVVNGTSLKSFLSTTPCVLKDIPTCTHRSLWAGDSVRFTLAAGSVQVEIIPERAASKPPIQVMTFALAASSFFPAISFHDAGTSFTFQSGPYVAP